MQTDVGRPPAGRTSAASDGAAKARPSVSVALFALFALAGCYPPQQQQQRPPPYYAPPPQQQPMPPQWGGYQTPAPAWPLPWLNPNLPSAPNPFDPSQRCVDAINAHRNQLGLRTVQRWVVAELCTSSEAQSAAQTGQPHGAFGRCGEHAQNVCPGWAGPADRMISPCIESEWQEGPGYDYMSHGHYLNMTNPQYTQVACGFFTAPNGQVWAVQNFR